MVVVEGQDCHFDFLSRLSAGDQNERSIPHYDNLRDKKLHICFFCNALSYQSGWGTYSESIICGMLNHGIKCTVLASNAAQLMPSRDGLRQFACLQSFPNDRQKPFRILRDHFAIKSLIADCDIVHCLVEPLSPLAATFASRARPFIFHAVGTHAVAPLSRALYGPLWRWAYSRASHVPCISAYTQKRILEVLPLRDTSVVPLGVDVSRFDYRVASFVPFVDRADERPILLGVGAVKPRKGYHIAIQAVAKIKERFPNVVYRIVGEIQFQSYHRRLKELVDRLGLVENVEFLGKVSEEELLRQYTESDLLMLTLVNEGKSFDGFGLVYLEANACGKPVVGSLDCGAETAVANNVSGFLVPQGDADAAANAAIRLLENRGLYDQMSASARAWAASMTWDRSVKSLIGIYDQILERK